MAGCDPQTKPEYYEHWECGSVSQHVMCMWEALGSVPSAAKQIRHLGKPEENGIINKLSNKENSAAEGSTGESYRTFMVCDVLVPPVAVLRGSFLALCSVAPHGAWGTM